MHYNVSKTDLVTRYEYFFEDNSSCCVLIVVKTGAIYIDIKSNLLFKELVKALKEVSDMISKEGLIPIININNSDNFLKKLAKKAGFKKKTCKDISFTRWVKYCKRKERF